MASMSIDNSPNNLPKLLLVDDHKILVEGLAQMLETRYEVMIACDLVEMQKCLALQDFDLVLLDLQMSDGNSCAHYRAVLQARKLPILIVAASISDAELYQCHKDGVCGYASKNMSKADFFEVLATVLQQGSYWTPTERSRLKDFTDHKPEIPKRFLPIVRHLLSATPPDSREIAAAENLGPRTVDNYISALLEAYHVSDRHQLIKKLREMGYTQDFLPD